MEKYTEYTCITREICRGWASCRRVQLENSIDRIERPTCNGVRATILTHLPIKLPLSDGSLPTRKRNIVEITSSARFARGAFTFNRLSPTFSSLSSFIPCTPCICTTIYSSNVLRYHARRIYFVLLTQPCLSFISLDIWPIPLPRRIKPTYTFQTRYFNRSPRQQKSLCSEIIVVLKCRKIRSI